MKLKIENIAPYLPYGLKFVTPSGRISGLEFNDNGLQIAKRAFDMASMSYRSISFSNALRDNKPVLRPMNLTKPIKIDGVEVVPFKELTKLYYNEVQDYHIKLDDVRANYIQVLINGNGFVCQVHRINLHFDTMKGCQIKWLYKHKFDLENLIEKGLAVDASTLDINPYDN